MANIAKSDSLHANNLHYLVVTALGSYQIGLLEAFSKLTKQCGCNIIESKLTYIGEECALVFYVAGTWNTIAKFEASLPTLTQNYALQLQMKRTLPRPATNALPYQVQVIAQDRVGIMNELASFFVENEISIDKMECDSYLARNFTSMTQITFSINIPAKQHIASLRERFMVYCEDLNLDAVIEPLK